MQQKGLLLQAAVITQRYFSLYYTFELEKYTSCSCWCEDALTMTCFVRHCRTKLTVQSHAQKRPACPDNHTKASDFEQAEVRLLVTLK